MCLRLPVAGAYLVIAAVVGGYLGLSTVRDRVVDERAVTAASRRRARLSRGGASSAPSSSPSGSSARTSTRRLAVPNIVRLADGRRFLTLTGFATSAGPVLRVRLVPGDTSDDGAPGSIDLGALKGDRGDQQYELPRRAGLADRTVVIWCRAFSAPFGSAPLYAA